MRCEDFPCCGHEAGCCPRYSEGGEQMDMVCTCGARLPVTARYSICQTCLNSGDDGGGFDYFPDDEPDDFDDEGDEYDPENEGDDFGDEYEPHFYEGDFFAEE